MSSDKDVKNKNLDMLLLIAGLLMILHLSYYCYGILGNMLSFGKLNIPLFMGKILMKLHQRSGLFAEPLYSKMLIFFFLILYSLGSKGKLNPNITTKQVYVYGGIGVVLFFGSLLLLPFFSEHSFLNQLLYMSGSLIGMFLLIKAGQYASRIFFFHNTNDIFNNENESFPQNQTYVSNEYAIHYKTQYYFHKKWHEGWINIINPFRSSMILGTPGSGKSFAILIPAIWQSIWKGYTAYIYDFKFPSLTLEAYNAYVKTIEANPYAWGKDDQGKPIIPAFYIINFDDFELSHRCNPLLPETLVDIIDAYESATTVMLNLNRSWVNKQGEFFVESAINFLTSVIWYLKLMSDKYKAQYEVESNKDIMFQNPEKLSLYKSLSQVCTFPHIIEFATHENPLQIFKLMASQESLEIYIRPFSSAAQAGAVDQLQGQLASVQIPIARLSSEILYWVMSGNDFTLDFNNPNKPKILCTGNNPERAQIYSAVFSLFTSKMIKTINKPNKMKSALFIDELPTIFFKGLDQLIATARSNKVATWLGVQDYQQLMRDYGEREAKVIQNVIGNLFSGQVVFETAEQLSKRFAETVQETESITIGREDTTVQLSSQIRSSLPASKIAMLKQGEFIGQFADNFGEEVELKSFKAQIVVDTEGMKKKVEALPKIRSVQQIVEKNYQITYDATQHQQYIKMILRDNYQRIKSEVKTLIELETLSN